MKASLRCVLWTLSVLTAAPAASSQAELQPCTQARVQALGFIEVATASLWLNSCSQIELQPPLQLQFDYVRSVPGNAMARAAMAMVERNLPEQEFAQLEDRLQAFSDRYRDIEKGDQYQLIYLQDGQVEMRLNGELLAVEQGHEFADAYLQIWFGPEPYSRDMKQVLLGDAR